MKRKPKTVTWALDRAEYFPNAYFANSAPVPHHVWFALGLPALRPGQKAKFKVTVEVVE